MKFAKPTLSALVLGGLALGGCGGVAENSELLDEIANQCRSAATEEGAQASMVDDLCDCTVKKVTELGPIDMPDQEKMQAIGMECAKEILGNGSAESAEQNQLFDDKESSR